MEQTGLAARFSYSKMSTFTRRNWVIPAAATLPVLACAFAFSLGPSPEKRLESIASAETPAEQAIAQLEAGGGKMVPLVVAAVKEPAMPHRRQAIAFLGAHGSKPVVPALERILTDDTEAYPFRFDALHALLKVDPDLGARWAKQLELREDALGGFARTLLADQDGWRERRTVVGFYQ